MALLWCERTLALAGVLALLVFAGARLQAYAFQREARAAFEESIARAPAPGAPRTAPDPRAGPEGGPAGSPAVSAPPPADAPGGVASGRLPWIEPAADTSLWSPGRVAAHEESLEAAPGREMGLLEIPGIDLSVLVLEGTDPVTLNRAVGWVEGTARPGEAGNVGIAGHRDGFFRGLEQVAVGDPLRLRTRGGDLAYRVAEIHIVDPEDGWVLDSRGQEELTLVTCYPFRYVGNAPLRYIVSAERVDVDAPRAER